MLILSTVLLLLSVAICIVAFIVYKQSRFDQAIYWDAITTYERITRRCVRCKTALQAEWIKKKAQTD